MCGAIAGTERKIMASEENNLNVEEEKELGLEEGEEDFDASVDLITLTDEEGVNHEFELVDTLERNGNLYVALIAGSEDPNLLAGDGNLVIMKSTIDENEEEYLELIEDDAEFEEVSDIFMDRLADLYEFEEDIELEDEE
jgi:uncharacterized protein YrzB (UPF0473 family)